MALAKKPEAGGPAYEGLVGGQVRPPTEVGRGPAKTRKSGVREPRLTNHKVRSRWFQARAAFPVREAPVRRLVAERARVAKTLPEAAGAEWESIGPTNIGGRCTSIVCDPRDVRRIWIGAAGGGVWFSADGGASWVAQWHDQDVLNVGSLAIDPVDPDILYCGTGEANLSADSYAGVGIYRTLDGGKEWHLLAARDTTGVPARIGVIAIDPFDRRHLLIGGVGLNEVSESGHDLGGLYESRDGGVSWVRHTFVSTRNYWCHSIVFDPRTRGRVYVTVTEQGSRSGIYRSTDGARTWTQLTRGLPPPERFGRTTLALAPSSARTLYALAADASSAGADRVLGIFRSSDGGNVWREIGGNHFRGESQMFYGNTIAVHPKRPNHVICGGVDLHLTTNASSAAPAWQQVTRWDATRGDSDYAHADHHALLMPSAQPGLIYDANDGGLDVSLNGGTAWENRSAGLAVTMFYDADLAQSDARVFGGGAQDNGTVITTSGQAGAFEEILGGDGGWLTWDPGDAGHLYASYQQFHIFRFRAGGAAEVSPPAQLSEREQVWMCYIAIDPNDPKAVFTGTSRVWRTLNDGASWKPVSPALDGSIISAIEIAPADGKRIYVGTENGGVFRSSDRGRTWTPNIAGSLLPGYSVTRLETSPVNAEVVYVTLANFGGSHVFRSRDGGLTWEDIDNRQLPNVPHHAIVAIRRGNAEHLYVGNDVGVYMSDDGGARWWSVSRNLPNTMIVDLVHHAAGDTLTVATYGRSLWRLKL